MANSPASNIEDYIAEEFLDEFQDVYNEIESILLHLEKNPANTEIQNSLFRYVHSVKGNLQLIGLNDIADFVHALETVLGKIRKGELCFTTQISDIVLLSLDHIRTLFTSTLNKSPIDNKITQDILSQLESLANNPRQISIAQAKKIAATLDPKVAGDRTSQSVTDIDFFENLGHALEIRSHFWRGRGKRLLDIALDLNTEAGSPVNENQLTAAVYMHDIGMAFLPIDILHKSQELNPQECEKMRTHPLLGANLVASMAHWKETEQMILQHHERVDGGGYPVGLRDSDICDGAKILAIADTFEAMTQESATRDHKRPLVRAVSEINSFSGQQFSEKWVAIFNAVLRKSIKKRHR